MISEPSDEVNDPDVSVGTGATDDDSPKGSKDSLEGCLWHSTGDDKIIIIKYLHNFPLGVGGLTLQTNIYYANNRTNKKLSRAAGVEQTTADHQRAVQR